MIGQTFERSNENLEHTFCPKEEIRDVDKITILLLSTVLFSYFVSIPPWGRCDTSFQHILMPFTKGYFMSSLVDIGQVVLE